MITSIMMQIEAQTTAYANARASLCEAVQQLTDETEALKRKHIGAIKRKVSAAAAHHIALEEAIKDAPHLFVKPRSVIISGIKIGFQKGKGTIEWTDDTKVIALIERHFPAEFDALVKTTTTLVKAALAQKSVADLKRLAITVSDTGDQVLIKPADSHVDKLVTALLANAVDDA